MATTKTREIMRLKDDDERRAWLTLAAGAASGVAGEPEDAPDDARDVSCLADALLVQYRKRCG